LGSLLSNLFALLVGLIAQLVSLIALHACVVALIVSVVALHASLGAQVASIVPLLSDPIAPVLSIGALLSSLIALRAGLIALFRGPRPPRPGLGRAIPIAQNRSPRVAGAARLGSLPSTADWSDPGCWSRRVKVECPS
jgi:hypothetical protein